MLFAVTEGFYAGIGQSEELAESSSEREGGFEEGLFASFVRVNGDGAEAVSLVEDGEHDSASRIFVQRVCLIEVGAVFHEEFTLGCDHRHAGAGLVAADHGLSYFEGLLAFVVGVFEAAVCDEGPDVRLGDVYDSAQAFDAFLDEGLDSGAVGEIVGEAGNDISFGVGEVEIVCQVLKHGIHFLGFDEDVGSRMGGEGKGDLVTVVGLFGLKGFCDGLDDEVATAGLGGRVVG